MIRKRYTAKRYPIAASLLKSEFKPLQLLDTGLNTVYNYERAGAVYSNIAPLVATADIMTDPFRAACIASAKTLLHFDVLQQAQDFDTVGSIIDGQHYYIYTASKKDGLISCSCMWFIDNICTGFSSVRVDADNKTPVGYIAQPEQLPPVTNTAGFCLLFYLFKAFAEVEKNILPVNKKTELFRCLYLNDLPVNITLLTCRWFTELHQNNPFFVRGHWKFQPHGAGNQLRKLIWVDTYTKGGYHSRADKDIKQGA